MLSQGIACVQPDQEVVGGVVRLYISNPVSTQSLEKEALLFYFGPYDRQKERRTICRAAL